MSAAHVVMQDRDMVCRHCGARMPMALPAPVQEAVRTMKAYVELHRACPAPTGGRP